jgi:hypothetical protein
MQAWPTFLCPPPRQSCTASTSALLFLESTRRVLGAVRPFLKELNRSVSASLFLGSCHQRGAVCCFPSLLFQADDDDRCVLPVQRSAAVVLGAVIIVDLASPASFSFLIALFVVDSARLWSADGVCPLRKKASSLFTLSLSLSLSLSLPKIDKKSILADGG